MLERIPNNWQQLSVFVIGSKYDKTALVEFAHSIVYVALLFCIRNSDVSCFTIVLQIRTGVIL